MTQTNTPRIALKVCPTTIAWLKDTLKDGADQIIMDDSEHEALSATLLELKAVFSNMSLLQLATHIGKVAGVDFYEHPDEGDEAPLMAYYADAGYFRENSGFWDLPEKDEAMYWISFVLKYQ